MGDFDILQANDAKAARKVRSKPQATLKLKKQLKKSGTGQLPRTQPFVNPQTPSSLSRTDMISKQRELDLSIKGFTSIPRPNTTPILTGLGPAGGIASTVGIAAAKLLLKAPGTRQVIQTLAGRASTIKPFGGTRTLATIGGALGIGITADALIEGGGRALDKLQQRGQTKGVTMHPSTGRAISTLPGVGGMLPPGTTIVKTWNTGTAQFARLADGRIAVQKKDGTIKVYRPQKHIVIPRNPRIGTLIRADKRLERLVKGLRKVVKSGKR